MRLSELSPSPGSKHKKKRVGRGPGSGWGKTAGRGEKGQNSRAGGGTRPGFEGGQMPLYRRLPKRGFCNIFKTQNAVLNIRELDSFDDGSVIDIDSLKKAGKVKGRFDGVKILGQGETKKKFVLKNVLVSKSAREKIESVGGSIE